MAAAARSSPMPMCAMMPAKSFRWLTSVTELVEAQVAHDVGNQRDDLGVGRGVFDAHDIRVALEELAKPPRWGFSARQTGWIW